jgi:hypothetical protein
VQYSQVPRNNDGKRFRISSTSCVALVLNSRWYLFFFEGTVSRNEQLRFSLSPEEAGLLIGQLPTTEVELFRVPSNESLAPDKVLRVIPSNTEILFKIECTSPNPIHPVDSIEEPTSTPRSGMLEVAVQCGEYAVSFRVVKMFHT